MKYYVRNGVLERMFGFELQLRTHPFMPVRVYGYNGATYRDELGNKTFETLYGIGKKRVAPIFTTVLHFGKNPWRTNLRLSDRATMSPDVARVMTPHFDDFKVRVVDFAGMSGDELSIFPTDIRIVAQYFRAKRRQIEYVPTKLVFVHTRQVWDFMKYVAGDRRFDFNSIMAGHRREPKTKCEVLDRIINKRVEEAVGEAFENGRKKERLELHREMAAELCRRGWRDEEIAQHLKVDVVDVRIWLDSERATQV